MEKLTKAEEPIMQQLWKLKNAFVKDILKHLPAPKPPYNTVSSIVRILETKGLVAHKAYGKTHEYYPIVTKKTYSQNMLINLIKDYFDGSYASALSFLLRNDKQLTDEEITELRKLINDKENE